MIPAVTPIETLPEDLREPLAELLLALADDKFILGQRNADWTGLGPILEEDIAFSSLAQDDVAHASALYEFIAQLRGATDNLSTEANRIAYGRKPEEYRCAAIVEQEDGFDWSVAIVRQFFCDHFDHLRLQRLALSVYVPLKQLAARLLAEERLAIGHADQWIVRLGNGTDESRSRIQSAITQLSLPAAQLFEPTAGVERLEQAGVYPPLPDDMFATWSEAIENVVEDATLRIELSRPSANFVGGRRGRHSPVFAALLDELTQVYRLEPDGAW